MPASHLLGMVPSSCSLARGLMPRCIALIIPLCSRSPAAGSSVYTGDGVCSAGFSQSFFPGTVLVLPAHQEKDDVFHLQRRQLHLNFIH